MKRLLIIGKTWPEPDSSAAGWRMMQIIHLFQRVGDWKLFFASPARSSRYAAPLEKLGISCFSVRLNDASVNASFIECNPDAVIFDRFMTEEQFGWRIAECCPDALRILDTEDLHFLRKARERALKNKSSWKEELYNSITVRELASILRSDLSLLISKAEMELLTHRFKIDKSTLFYLPFLMKELEKGSLAVYPDFQERKDFLFVGNFKHAPNRDAVQELKKELWPQIRSALPDAVLKIGGAYTPPQIRQLHNPRGGFEVLGRIRDLDKTLRTTRLLLAPLRFGAGLKGKFFDAMKNGTPAVTTRIGGEGIGDEETFPGCLVDSSKMFIQAAVDLYQNEERWLNLQHRIYMLIEQEFSRNRFYTLFFEQIEDFITQLEERRQKNFWQQLVLQHRLQSTKYMARWIEAKNTINTEK